MTLDQQERDIVKTLRERASRKWTDEANRSASLFGQAADEIERLRAAIQQTLDENGHLADGEVCPLIVLKRALDHYHRERDILVRSNEQLKAENEEQARLLGMSAERELTLLAKLERCEKERCKKERDEAEELRNGEGQ